MRAALPEGAPRGGVLLRPGGAHALLVLAHGAGAGMRHPFMEGVAQALHGEGIATWRYDFAYMAAGRKLPPRGEALVPEVVRSVTAARAAVPDLPLFAGGKSLGGRMTSTAAARGELPSAVRGLVLFGFPLHPAGRPATERARHLQDVSLPVFILQGERDPMGEPGLLRRAMRGRAPAVQVHAVAGADHGFEVLRRSRRTGDEVLRELARTAACWMADQTRR
ncbi:MAG: alpha/beta fold hydrolase [Longimicrobiales bacterium]|nr:alpha/beta fold hydrolase [Longimicrobiales bacterium]